MKKIFTLFAVALTAMSMQAQQTISFAGLTADDVTANEAEWTWNEAKTELSVAAGAENVDHPITVKGVVFSTKRASGDRFFRLQETGLYANGTNVNITVSGLKKEQVVTFTLKCGHATTPTTISAVSGCTADENNPENAPADGDFTSFKFKATGSSMTIKNGGTRFTISTIEIGEAPEGVQEVVEEVATTTLWTLTGVEDGAALCTENVVNYNNSGLFLRSNNADGSHSIKAFAETVEGQFSDGTAYTTAFTFNCPGSGLGESGTSGKTANANAASGNDRCVAFNAAADGTLYVAIRTTSFKEDRELYIWSSEGVKVASKPLTDSDIYTVEAGGNEDSTDKYTYYFVELKTDVKAGLSYFIGGSNQNHIAAILFKTGTATAIRQLSVNQTDGVTYSLSGQRVAPGFHGIVIKNGKKIVIR